MPNWCSNDLKITGPSARIHELAKAVKKGEFLSTVLPEPDYRVTPVADTFPKISALSANTEEERAIILKNEPVISPMSGWHWRVQNWGTKWEIRDVDPSYIDLKDLDDKTSELSFSFDSAWSPPFGVLGALDSEEGIEVEAWWCEEGCDFGGRIKDGVRDDFEPSSLMEIITPFHQEIENRFGVISSNIEWAKEEAKEAAENTATAS